MKQTHYRAIFFCTYIPILIYLLGYLFIHFYPSNSIPSWIVYFIFPTSFSILIITPITCIVSLILGIKSKDWKYILLGILPPIIFYIFFIKGIF